MNENMTVVQKVLDIEIVPRVPNAYDFSQVQSFGGAAKHFQNFQLF